MTKLLQSLSVATLLVAGLNAQARVASAKAAKASRSLNAATVRVLNERPGVNAKSSRDLSAALAQQSSGTTFVVSVGAKNIVQLAKSDASDEVVQTSLDALVETVENGGVSCTIVNKTCSKTKKANQQLMITVNSNGGLPIGATKADAIAGRDALVLLLQANPKLAKMPGYTRLVKLYTTYLGQSRNAVAAVINAINDWKSTTKYKNKTAGQVAGLITANCAR